MKAYQLLIAGAILGMSAQALAGPPAIYDPKTGKFLGYLSNNEWDPNSVSNKWGRYGSEWSPDSVNNPWGKYGSPYGQDSARNPTTRGGNAPRPVMPPPTLPGANPY